MTYYYYYYLLCIVVFFIYYHFLLYIIVILWRKLNNNISPPSRLPLPGDRHSPSPPPCEKISQTLCGLLWTNCLENIILWLWGGRRVGPLQQGNR